MLYYRKRAAIIGPVIVCFVLATTGTVLGDTMPSTPSTEQVQQDMNVAEEAQPVISTELSAISDIADESAAQPADAPVEIADSFVPVIVPVLDDSPVTEVAVVPSESADTRIALNESPASEEAAVQVAELPRQTESAPVQTVPPAAAAQKTATAPAAPPAPKEKPAPAAVAKEPAPAKAPAAQKPAPKATAVAKAPAPKASPKPVQSGSGLQGVVSNVVNTAKSLVNRAMSWLGIRYVWGGTSRNGVDCSGLTKQLYAEAGIKLPRTAKQQANAGVKVAKSALKPGDLVFFNTSRGPLTHVGMYIGDNKFLHAANPRRGVRIDSLDSAYYKKRYATARRYAG